MGFFSCRSIWTFASRQSSILPASLTPAAPAPPVTTLCFPMTRYQTSPASPNTSTSMAMSKHEPPPLSHPKFRQSCSLPSVSKNTHSAEPPPILDPVPSHQMDYWNHLGQCRWQRCYHMLILPCIHATYGTWSRDVLKEWTGILQKLFFMTEWTENPAPPVPLLI